MHTPMSAVLRAQLYLYGPLANAANQFNVRRRADLSGCLRFWNVIDKHQVSIFYSTDCHSRPDEQGDDFVTRTSRKSLRLLGTVGERSIRKPGAGITASSAIRAARWSIPGGKTKPAVF